MQPVGAKCQNNASRRSNNYKNNSNNNNNNNTTCSVCEQGLSLTCHGMKRKSSDYFAVITKTLDDNAAYTQRQKKHLICRRSGGGGVEAQHINLFACQAKMRSMETIKCVENAKGGVLGRGCASAKQLQLVWSVG